MIVGNLNLPGKMVIQGNPGLKPTSLAPGFQFNDTFGRSNGMTVPGALRQQKASHEQALGLTLQSNMTAALHKLHLSIAQAIGQNK